MKLQVQISILRYYRKGIFFINSGPDLPQSTYKAFGIGYRNKALILGGYDHNYKSQGAISRILELKINKITNQEIEAEWFETEHHLTPAKSSTVALPVLKHYKYCY